MSTKKCLHKQTRTGICKAFRLYKFKIKIDLFIRWPRPSFFIEIKKILLLILSAYNIGNYYKTEA